MNENFRVPNKPLGEAFRRAEEHSFLDRLINWKKIFLAKISDACRFDIKFSPEELSQLRHRAKEIEINNKELKVDDQELINAYQEYLLHTRYESGFGDYIYNWKCFLGEELEKRNETETQKEDFAYVRGMPQKQAQELLMQAAKQLHTLCESFAIDNASLSIAHIHYSNTPKKVSVFDTLDTLSPQQEIILEFLRKQDLHDWKLLLAEKSGKPFLRGLSDQKAYGLLFRAEDRMKASVENRAKERISSE